MGNRIQKRNGKGLGRWGTEASETRKSSSELVGNGRKDEESNTPRTGANGVGGTDHRGVAKQRCGNMDTGGGKKDKGNGESNDVQMEEGGKRMAYEVGAKKKEAKARGKRGARGTRGWTQTEKSAGNDGWGRKCQDRGTKSTRRGTGKRQGEKKKEGAREKEKKKRRRNARGQTAQGRTAGHNQERTAGTAEVA